MIPKREIFWNISFGSLLYILATISVAVMAYAFYRRYRLWHLGKADVRAPAGSFARWKIFIYTALLDGLIHRKLFGIADNLGHRRLTLPDLVPKELYAGTYHFLIFSGFIVLLIGTAMDVVSHYGYEFLTGNVYLGHTIAMNIAGLAVMIGIVLAALRRYVIKPARLDNKKEDFVALLVIFLIVITGFLIQAVRLAYAEPAWAWWSPVGNVLSFVFTGLSRDFLLVVHRSLWWFHVFLSLGAMIYVALSWNRLWHIVVSPINIFYGNLGSRGAMVPIDIEKADTFGVAEADHFSWKDLLDLDACTRCGRCIDICPAHLSGKPLSPKKVLQDLKNRWLAIAPALLVSRRNASDSKSAVEIERRKDIIASFKAGSEAVQPMIGSVVETDAIWNCTTCFACQEVCPVLAEPMLKITEMRRNLVMEQASIPETAEGALRSIEDRGHPWRGTPLTRTGWFEGMNINTLAEDDNVDILYWVGCTESLEDRSVKVAQAIGKLLKMAGVKFGVLGYEESCCGDPARRLGDEYLYQLQAEKNIETLKRYHVKKIVTGCPHCFNTLKNEYPQFGGRFEVIHHVDFLLQLLEAGKLGLKKILDGFITYHDPCYLGRYNNIYENPRRVLNFMTGLDPVEMDLNRERSFCCGAGGGHMWLEEQKVGARINILRTEQAIATNARIVATACPYCLQMFQDGITTKSVEENFQVLDVAEILSQLVMHGSVDTAKT